MGSDSFGRDIYSRVLYGTRVSLLVGIASRAGRARVRHGLRAGRGLPALARRPADARDGRPDGDPGDPARHRAGGAVAREPADRDRGDRHPGDPARHAAGALARALDPRGALRRGRGRARHADAEDHVRPHPAQHRRAAPGAGHLHLRLRDPAGIDPVLPRRRPAARHPDLGKHHGRGPRAVRRLSAQRVLSRRVPRRHGARGQHPRRRPARHARSRRWRSAYERARRSRT